ncbi:MAG: hypothetical protein CFE22_12995 [Cytophagaceae bacterium BCCC1]|nr:MAG: hypothetical protein CFE22_12995 [Cytophagaceae bacterium BCCC1]
MDHFEQKTKFNFINMTRPILFVILFHTIFSFYSQIPISKSELKKIFNDIIPNETNPTKYFLVDSIVDFQTQKITQSKITYKIATCDITNKGTWSNELFKNIEIIATKTLDSIAGPGKQNNVPKHYSFSLPYFSKEKKSFIIYYNKYCGDLCAEYSLRLYTIKHGKWIFVKSIFRIVS